MARKTYKLSNQTFLALVDHEPGIADEMDCDPSYIYGIKNQKHPDPYPKFRELYRADVRAGGGYEHWDNDMAAIRASVEKRTDTGDTMKCLLEKIHLDAVSTERIVKSLDDGILNEREIAEILRDVKKIRQNTSDLESGLYRKLGELRAQEESKL